MECGRFYLDETLEIHRLFKCIKFNFEVISSDLCVRIYIEIFSNSQFTKTY